MANEVRDKIAIVLDGGLVQNVFFNDAKKADVLIIDLDVEGADEGDLYPFELYGEKHMAAAHITDADLDDDTSAINLFADAEEAGVPDLRGSKTSAAGDFPNALELLDVLYQLRHAKTFDLPTGEFERIVARVDEVLGKYGRA